MTRPNTPLVERLCSVDSPLALNHWERRDGYYVAACRVSADDIPDLIDIVRKWNDVDWPSDADVPAIDQEDAELLPITAWRTLADLKADAAVEPLVDILRGWGSEEYDDWVPQEFPHVFGKIGEPAIESLTRLAKDAREEEIVRSIAARGLRRVVEYHAHTRDRIVPSLTEMMAEAAAGDVEFNSKLLVELVELQAVEAAEAIERAFAENLLDIGMMGDWEEVRRQLGVEGLGLAMPENPHNSINDLRRRMGIGIFSDQPVFGFDEIDADAEEAYYQRAFEAFSKSSEAQKVIDQFGDVGWFRMLLEFGVNYRGEIVDEMTLGSIREFVLDYVPRKVSTDSDAAASIVGELASFWEYLDRAYELPEARPIVEWLETDDLVARLEAELSDSSNFGMAKSLFMLGKNSGYDMTSEAGIGEFMLAYNQSLQNQSSQSDKTPAPPPATITRGQRVGRNDPCPCGSGKKYKKCCR